MVIFVFLFILVADNARATCSLFESYFKTRPPFPVTNAVSDEINLLHNKRPREAVTFVCFSAIGRLHVVRAGRYRLHVPWRQNANRCRRRRRRTSIDSVAEFTRTILILLTSLFHPTSE